MSISDLIFGVNSMETQGERDARQHYEACLIAARELGMSHLRVTRVMNVFNRALDERWRDGTKYRTTYEAAASHLGIGVKTVKSIADAYFEADVGAC